jgi:hypothetical protein
MLVVKPTGRGCCLLSVYASHPLWRNNCLNVRIGGILFICMDFKDDANVIQVSPPIVQLYKLPSEIPGVCVWTMGRMQMLNYPLYSIHPSHNIPVRDHAKPTFAPRVTEFVRLLLCAIFSNRDDRGAESLGGGGMYVIVGPSSDYKVSSTDNAKPTASLKTI